jgi:hypothetical protein
MASVCATAKFQWVDNDLSREKHLIPPAPHVMQLLVHSFWASCPVLFFANLMSRLPFHLLALMAMPRAH